MLKNILNMPTNKFHYIWMGSVLPKYEEAFKVGPNDLARQLRELIYHSNTTDIPSLRSNPQDQEIIMWVPEDIIENIKERNLLDPLITLKPIEDIYKNPEHISKSEIDKLKRSVDVLGNHKAYSAQKDVISAAILEEYGGYYFDTTTLIDSVSTLMDNQPSDIWFPRIYEKSQSYDGSTLIYAGEKYYTTTYSKDGKEHTFCDTVPLPDVWAMHYSTPGNGILKKMMNKYIEKCQYFFPESFNNTHLSKSSYEMLYEDEPFNKSGYSLGAEGSGAQLMQNASRDKLIGELVIFSLLDAVIDSYGEPTHEVMEEISSPAIDEGDYRFVESMGIKKFHNGIWRQEEMATRMDYSISAPPIIQPVAQKEVQESQEKPRTHMLAVKATAFQDIKLKYQQMKGDTLKREIIADFRKQIAAIDDLEVLNLFVEDFKKSVSYDVLKTGQGMTSRICGLETGSVKTINAIVREKTSELEQSQADYRMRK